jgi:tRNA threonylcarbamoyladenosine biosynthesis protein TsaE
VAHELKTRSAKETIELGRAIGEQLRGGEVMGLVGPLGSGKTHLIKGIAEGLGAEGGSERVSSPTFVLVNEYEGRLEVYHIDAYRLDSVGQFEQIGFDDYCHLGSVVLIEWADKVESVLEGADCIRVELTHLGRQERSVKFKNVPPYVVL